MSHCNGCNTTKPTSEFYRDGSKAKGHHSICIACTLAKRKRRYWADPVAGRARNRAWFNANKDRYKEYSRQLKWDVVEAYGGKCVCCGEDRIEFLTVDHVDGGGKAHRRTLGGYGRSIYRWLKLQGFPQEGYQLLCWNCNCAKGFYGVCPHVVGSIWGERVRTRKRIPA
jgi:hypothetical protein